MPKRPIVATLLTGAALVLFLSFKTPQVAGLNANGAIAIVTSPDGINWHLASTLKGTWTLSAGRRSTIFPTVCVFTHSLIVCRQPSGS